MKLRKIFASGLFVLCLTSLVACNGLSRSSSAGALAERLQVLHRLDKDGRPLVSARVVDLSTGRELYAENATEPVLPASNMKLFITTAALDFFGPDHAFRTYLAMDGDDLWIIGTGDPGVGDDAIAGRRTTRGRTMTVLEDWSRALRSRGVSQVRGKLYYYDGALEAQQVHASWDEDDLPNWYAAPISGLNFNDNCIDITVYPTEPGQPVRYEVIPPVQGIKIINNCITGAKGDPDCERALKENVYTLKGGCSKRTALKSKPVTNPGAFFADALREQLRKDGIEVLGSIERAEAPLGGKLEPPGDKVVAVHETTVRELLPRINKNSQNLLAEGLCKLLGRAYDQQHGRGDVPGSWTSGSDAVHAFLKRHRIGDHGIVIADGSGLSRDNRVTTGAISDLLVKMRAHPHGDVFFDSLSVGGVDGTIRSRFADRPGVVHAKTGFIGGVRSLSGYVPTGRGEIVFSFIYNRIPGSVKPYEELQDYAVRTLMSWPELDYVPPPATQPTTSPVTQPAPVAAGD